MSTSSQYNMEVDGIRLDPNNYEFMQALAIAQATKNNLYLTGKAGSGKTFFLKYLFEPIPMKEILGENYVFDEAKHDFIEITIQHNLVKHYQARHEICSIPEALGKE